MGKDRYPGALRPLDRCAREFAAPMGSAIDFHRRILIPHFFLWVALLVIGGAMLHDATSFAIRVSALIYIIIAGLAAHASREYVSHRWVVLHALVMGAGAVITAVIFRLEPLTHVFLPLAGLAAPLWAARMPRAVAGAVGAGIVLEGSIFMLAMWSGAGDTAALQLGAVLVCAAALGVVCRAQSEAPGAPPSPRSGVNAAVVEHSNSAPEALTESFPAHDLMVVWNRTAVGEYRGDVVWRLVGVGLTIGGVVWAVVCRAPLVEPYRAVSWLGIGVLFLALLLRIGWGRGVVDVTRAALLVVVAAAAWWELMLGMPVGVTLAPEAVLFGLIIGVGPLPWPRTARFLIAGLFLFLIILRGLAAPEPGLVWFGGVLLTLGVFRLSTRAWFDLKLRTALHLLRRIGESSPSSVFAVRALAWQIAEIVENDRALVLLGERSAEVVRSGSPEPSAVDLGFVRTLFRTIEQRGFDEGQLSFRDLDERFLSPCLDWFGFAPTEFAYVSMPAIINGREEKLVIIAPLRFAVRVAGRTRTLRAVGGLAALVRGWISSARVRFQSSDVLLASQRSISVREEELNQLIHLVNNVAQDISAECDSLRGLIRGLESPPDLAPQIDGIERLARNLSSAVSDIKLLKELFAVRVFNGADVVDVDSLLEEAAVFGRYRAHRSGCRFEFESHHPAGRGIRVASREFLALVLRLLVREAEARGSGGGSIKLEVGEAGGESTIRVRFEAAPDCGAVREAAVDGEAGEPAPNEEGDAIKAARTLARLSGGSFSGGERGCAEFVLRLPSASAAPRRDHPREGWILLVDDNPQVTGFYARVAEAMELRYFTAVSVREGEDLAAKHGRPRLVITDIQLREGSGLDLVRSLRRLYGSELPIVVVSGATGGGVVEEVTAAGGTVYLAKPVGRARLFAEIRALLGR